MTNQLNQIRRNVGLVAHSSTINWGESYEVAIGTPKKVREVVQTYQGFGYYYWAGAWVGPFDTHEDARDMYDLEVADAIDRAHPTPVVEENVVELVA